MNWLRWKFFSKKICSRLSGSLVESGLLQADLVEIVSRSFQELTLVEILADGCAWLFAGSMSSCLLWFVEFLVFSFLDLDRFLGWTFGFDHHSFWCLRSTIFSCWCSFLLGCLLRSCLSKTSEYFWMMLALILLVFWCEGSRCLVFGVVEGIVTRKLLSSCFVFLSLLAQT